MAKSKKKEINIDDLAETTKVNEKKNENNTEKNNAEVIKTKSQSSVVQAGNTVNVDYTGTLEDGTIFDSSINHGQPLEFQVGSGQLIKGFDTAVLGMKKGEEKEIKLQPLEAYGESRPELIKDIPKSELPPGQEFKAGTILMMNLPNGMQIPLKVIDVKEDAVTFDLNHPLAGKVLIFKIKIVEISE